MLSEMDLIRLKNIQEPLKEKYRSAPESALITLKATAHLGAGISCKIDSGKMLVTAGLHPATGGDGLAVCAGDMLLESLAACAGVTLRTVATAINFDLQDAQILVEGDLDFRGTLSIDRNVPVGFTDIRLRFQLDTNESNEKIDTLIKLTERYCVVFQTLVKENAISVSVN
ncbi:MAG: OsmC family protein [Maribacter sp.]|nr:OsmC family protein [Maribacter sp.]